LAASPADHAAGDDKTPSNQTIAMTQRRVIPVTRMTEAVDRVQPVVSG
jgi:hypothetical protein